MYFFTVKTHSAVPSGLQSQSRKAGLALGDDPDADPDAENDLGTEKRLKKDFHPRVGTNRVMKVWLKLSHALQ